MNWFNNPEFKRNTWLELTLHRLIIAPVVLLLIFSMRTKGNTFDIWLQDMATVAVWIFIAVTVVWGAGLSFNSIAEEVRQKTWDWQRVSAIQPWSMVWGKVLGSTAFAWYIGLPCLLIIALAPDANLFGRMQHKNSIDALALLWLALGAQGLGLLLALFALASNQILQFSRGMFAVPLLLIIYMISRWTFSFIGQYSTWYGISFTDKEFNHLSLAFFTFWIWLGCYRLMQETLLVKTRPWAAVGFIVAFSVYLTGMHHPGATPAGRWQLLAVYGFVLGGTVTYLGGWNEQLSWVRVKRLWLTWRQGNLSAALLETPFFMATMAFTLLCLAALLMFDRIGPAPVAKFIHFDTKQMLVILFLILLRDLAILFYIGLFGGKNVRATAFFYIILLDVFLPVLLPRDLGYWFLPIERSVRAAYEQSQTDNLGLLIAVIHLAVIGWLISRKLQVNSIRQ